MAAVGTPAHVSKKSSHYSTFGFPLSVLPNSTSKLKQSLRVRCALSTPAWREGRRLVSISLPLSHLLLIPNRVAAESFLDKYVKRKKLDALEVYVPAVILTQLQIKELGKAFFFSLIIALIMESFMEENRRSVLRFGPAASLRVNIRAVAQYASDNGNGETAFDNVDQCLRALEELDSLLPHASRNEPDASVKSMKAKINSALNALDSLLQTVPSDVLSKGKVVADSYRNVEDVEPESLDPEIKQLESIL